MKQSDGSMSGSRNILRATIEFAVVGGASLLAIFWIIPAQTTAGTNFGLSPTMVPIVCAATIGILAAVQYLLAITRLASIPRKGGNFPVAVAIILAAIIGVFFVGKAGLILGGMLIVGLISLVIGTRRPIPLAAMVSGAGLLLFLVQRSGI